MVLSYLERFCPYTGSATTTLSQRKINPKVVSPMGENNDYGSLWIAMWRLFDKDQFSYVIHHVLRGG